MIAVEDDGIGMDREDAELAVERHATSKIRDAGDLAAIRTLGFRGEALPSIASVSRFRLRTRARGALAGTEVRVEGGRPTDTRDVGAPEGTLVEVADLFFNLPARRKFLKADTAESAQVSRLVTQLALGYPDVGFVLRSHDRVLLEAPPARSAGERFFQIYGDRPDLVAVAKDAAGIRVHGFVAALSDQGPARGPQHVFVNRRMVRDRTIAHAIQQAYSVATIKERSPEVHLFIELRRGPRRRERASDEGRGAVPRSRAGARNSAPRRRRRARSDVGAGTGAGARGRRVRSGRPGRVATRLRRALLGGCGIGAGVLGRSNRHRASR